MSVTVTSQLPSSIENVVAVQVLRGAKADAAAPPDLLVEVPHGADRRSDYDGLRSRLVGDLPADLHEFFHLNTDVGAWACGLATAEAILEAAPERSVLLLRCLVPRTFIDCNRPADSSGGDLAQGGLTAGIPSYVRDDDDRALLLDLHGQYLRAAEAAYAGVCGVGGLALVPHTYGPRSLGIAAVDDDIVKNLHWACAEERVNDWPLRAEVDLLTRDGQGVSLAPHGSEAALLSAFTAAGYAPKANETYFLHPGSLGHTWSARHPHQVFCLEVRRDLLVDEWTPFEEMHALPEQAERVAFVLAPVIEATLRIMRLAP